MERRCYKCKQPGGKGKRELRPYGPNGSDVCAGCVFGTDEKGPNEKLIEEARKQLGKQMAMVGDEIAVIDPTEQVGPRAPTTEEKKRFKKLRIKKPFGPS
jgi:hypothetical protein